MPASVEATFLVISTATDDANSAAPWHADDPELSQPAPPVRQARHQP
jgi:hypothetical protein